jgi:hypothetical protein
MKYHPKIKFFVRPVSKQIRHTHSTAAALEDALAVANDVIEELLRSQLYVRTRVQKLTEILRETREGPHAYNPDKPAGVRLVIRKR